MEPRSRRPKKSPTKLTDDIARQAVAVRAALEQSGLDHGPISVHDKMKALGLTAWLAGHTTPTARTYTGLAHGIHAKELGDVRDFLASHVRVGIPERGA